MSIFLTILASICFLVSLPCAIFIVVKAFQDEAWKGVLCLLCGIYFVYYVIVEWAELEYNGLPISIIWAVSFLAAGLFTRLARS